MKTNSTQQEVILVTGTSFLLRGFFETSDELTYNQLTEKDKLKLACRNGFLPDMLPELFEQRSANKKLCLWEMNKDSLFIELKWDEIHFELEMQFSIDPYSFLAMQVLS